jgi:hypothetical protein
MLIDFKEIPQSNGTGHQQDIFEKFCRDFLESMGYTVLSEPGRGADGGLDIKVEETRTGIGGITRVTWLVSCKHYAHSGKSITKVVEPDIRDRVEAAQCIGFIGFYSSTIGQSLIDFLGALPKGIAYQLFDNEKIESYIVGVKERESLMMRYFPDSYKKWKEAYYFLEPIKLFDSYITGNERYKDSLLLTLFKTTPELLKALRNNENLAQALKKERLHYYMIPEFSEATLNNTFPQVFDAIRSALERKGFDPGIVSQYMSFSLGRYGEIRHALYASALFVGEKYGAELESSFQELKDIIE